MKNIVFVFAVLSLVTSCSEVGGDELWREKIELENGSYIFVYHSCHCSKDKPLLAAKEKKIKFIKYKFDVFHYCINGEEVVMLNAISRRNIAQFIKNEEYYVEDKQDLECYKNRKFLFDTTERDHTAYYSFNGTNLLSVNYDVFIQYPTN